MSAEAKRFLWAILALGAAVRVALAFSTFGFDYDVNSFVIVREVLGSEGLDVYGTVNAVQPVMRWPYPPAFFPVILGADGLASVTPLAFHGLIQLPAIAADLTLAWIAQAFLGSRGASDRSRLAAAALIALGPVFILISGYHGQIDSLAILPAVAALVVWERGGTRRGLAAGALIGLGAAIKIVPGFMLLALLPSARSWREGITLAAVAIAIPAAMLVPFAISDPAGVGTIAEYKGGPGQGGLTLALQPGLAELWLQGPPVEFNGAVEFLFERGVALNLVTLLLLVVFLGRFRPSAPLAAVIVWLALWAFGTSFFFHYLIWGLPFVVMAGYHGAAAAIQGAVVMPALLFYLGPWSTDLVLAAYVPMMIALWLALLAWLGTLALRTARSAHSVAPG